MNIKKQKGFSLIELLATICIISIILSIGGYFALNTINNSKKQSQKLTINSIKTSARYYVEENNNNIPWITKENSSQKYSCVPILELINKGYLTEEGLEKNSISKEDSIIITKDNNGTIISEAIDKDGSICSQQQKRIIIPTTSKFCKSLYYTGEELTLTKNPENQYYFQNNKHRNAGNYEVTVSLTEEAKSNGYAWNDNTIENKKITCSIKKAIPTLKITPPGLEGSTIETNNITLLSNVTGTISLKTSNKDYATASTSDNKITKEKAKTIKIQIHATRKSPTYITITITPTGNDAKNYYSTSAVYTIGKVTKKEVPIPTCKSNLYYNETQQNLIESSEGIKLVNNQVTKIGKYNVTAKLKYGYIWSDKTEDQKTITCSILRPTPIVSYNNNGGSKCTNKTVTYEHKYGELCTPKRTGYTFSGWYTTETGGTQITSDTIVTAYTNHTIYAHWTPINYLLDINPDNNSYGTNYNNGSRIASFDVKVVAEDGVTVLDEQKGISDYYSSKGTYNSTYYITNVKYRGGYHYYNYGFSVNGVNITTANGSSFTFKHNVANNITFSINSAINVCTITYHPNSGIFNSNATNTIQTMNYGTSTDNMRNASGGTYKATRTGYHINAGSAWSSSLGGTFDQTKGYNATDFCPNLTSGNQSVTLYANWQINVCTIQYKSNGGTFGSNANNTTQTMNYGTSISNMRNASGGTYKATRSGYKIKASEAWIKQDGTKYNQDLGYNASNFCPSLASGNQTVNLYVYWYRIQKRTYNCSTNCVGGTVTSCFSGWNINTCKQVEEGYWKNGKCCQDRYNSCASTTTSCAWSSWSTVNSCSSSSTVKCRTQHPTPQD